MGGAASLLRTFPAHAVAIPLSTFQDPRFRQELASNLEKLDAEVIDEVSPSTKKAGSKVTEVRDTAHPRLVTEMFMAILAAVGAPIKVRQVQKRTRDDVLWNECLLPWRRSALWLTVRVAIQTTLMHMLPNDKFRATILYKNFMAFIMTEIASLACAASLPKDVCLVINAKVARRIFKLGAHVDNFISGAALTISRATKKEQGEMWSALQVQDAERAATIDPELSFQPDTSLTLDNSRGYLDSVLAVCYDQEPRKPSSFEPLCNTWVSKTNRGLPHADCLVSVGKELVYVLFEIESWVSDRLAGWVLEAVETPHDDDCSAIASLAKEYYLRASIVYKNAPEQNSIMILTLAEMWQGVDSLATNQIPLLREFPPEVDPKLFCPMLLPRREQMQRLYNIEAYITRRNQEVKTQNPSIFSDQKELSFATRFTAGSNEHKALRRQIEFQASEAVERKKEEHRGKEADIRQMQQEATKLLCQTNTDETGMAWHSMECKKCELERSITEMSIEIYEWPLPQDEASCESAVFELDCPKSFAAWRSVTWLIVNDLGRPPMASVDNPAATLFDYAGLHSYAKNKQSRLTFASKKKSFTKAHYKELTFPVPIEKCLVPNALEYQLFDTEKRVWVYSQAATPSIARLCITVLPEGPYSNLQYAVDSTFHGQNRVISEQETCSRELNLHEFIAFGSLRADGERVQWLNIKRELAASNLNLNTEAVCTLLTQAAWQAGSKEVAKSRHYKLRSGISLDARQDTNMAGTTTDQVLVLRMSHADFSDTQFCEELLSTISGNLKSIGANWKSDHALLLLLVITLRLLSLCTGINLISSALAILNQIRGIAEKWTHDLVGILHKSKDDEQIVKVRRRIFRVTILCRMTYSVDRKYVSQVMKTAEDIRCWIFCSVRLQENTPADTSTLSDDLRRLLIRDQRTSHSLHQKVQQLTVDESNDGLTLAIKQILSDFESPTTGWTLLPYPRNRWMHVRTKASVVRESQDIHYNVLEGELIIDGMPLGRLPMDYVRDDLYKKIFGAQILHVSLADLPGMRFMTSYDAHQYKVYFGMREGRLVIRTRRGGELLELIPKEHFAGDMPADLLNGYTHWLNLSSRVVEFRPLELTWISSTSNWRLAYPSGSSSHLSNGERWLVDVRSKTYSAVMEIFNSLEEADFIHVTMFQNSQLEVYLARLKLNFFFNHAGHLECRELRKIVDNDQSVGTLIGLESRLVLCDSGDLGKKHDRVVIIPFGEPIVTRPGAHVQVKVKINGNNVSFCTYRLDMDLKRLCGDGTMPSTLYKAYLHALTSYIYQDPFTGCTGTDEALMCLQEQLTRCSEPLDEESTKLLSLISALTPSREYYPKHLKVMQQTRWHPMLSQWAQHDDFFFVAEQIMLSANRFTIFYPDGKIASLKSSSDRTLLQRARVRNSTYRGPDSGGNVLLHDDAMEHCARDRSSMTEESDRVYEIASLILAWPSKLNVSKDIAIDLLSWSTLSGIGTKYSTSRPISELLELSFASSWGPLQGLCRSSSRESKYNLMFLFSIIAYGHTAPNLTILRTLLAFAFASDLSKLKPPAYSFFPLDKGCAPTKAALRQIIASRKLGFQAPRGASKTERRQRKAVHEQRADEQISTLIRHYKNQWPCDKPNAPATGLASLVDVRGAHSEVSALFLECAKNVEFTTYLQHSQVILDNIHQESGFPIHLPSHWQSSERIPFQLMDHNCMFPTVALLMATGPPELMPLSGVPTAKRPSEHATTSQGLRSVVTALRMESGNLGQRSIRRLYADDLMTSLDAYQNHKEIMTQNDFPYSLTMTLFHRTMVWHHVDEMSKSIRGALSPRDQLSKLLELAGFWPRLTLRSLLKLLSKTSTYTLGPQWYEALIALGEAVTMLQRARRLVLARERLDILTYYDEIENVGRQGWNCSELPDWLLIDIENDFLIRPLQARVALEMIQPSSSANSLVQLNMGEGKSSVIIPLVAVALADGSRMVRILVLKSLSKQMTRTITRRLGGLVDRKIYYMPFSRAIAVDEHTVWRIEKMQKECMNGRGVLLAQPEHVLSFKLMGIEKLASGHHKLAARLLASQKWLEENSRDILDESDEILDVRFQLIYTLGTPRMMDGQPDRWHLVQELFDSIDKHASTLQSTHSTQIELERRSSSSFPTVRLLSAGIGDVLISLLAHDVVESQLPGLNLTNCPLQTREAISRFIQEYHVTEVDCLRIEEYFNGEQSIMQKLFLLRGLFAYKILLFVLRDKRWSVNYGLHPTRCLSAVPYRAKGVPAPSAEFGHPDVAIALTCLTYYYSGLSNPQIRKCFELLQRSDDPTVEYARWIERCTLLPDCLRTWTAINLEDDHQCEYILFPILRFSKTLGDYFLNSVVFPQEGKEFDEKLSTSGWDIPSSPGAKNLTTGFSGTNDNRFLLPLTISQQDLPELQHTSGKVLDYVTRPENLRYYYARDGDNQQMSAEHLLQYISNVEPTIRVLIDVGAQVLDKCNSDVVKDWLQLIADVDAGVYFDEDDNIMVLARDREPESLAMSSFQDRMDRCVIYLDEVHTRGTDLKLPNNARAAVTLGPRLTKDKLVQGTPILGTFSLQSSTWQRHNCDYFLQKLFLRGMSVMYSNS